MELRMREGFVTEGSVATMEPPADARQRRPQARQQPPEPQPPQQQPEPQPPAEPTEPPPPPEWPIVVKLRHKSINGNKREVLEELTFREPTGADIVRIGNPVFITSTGEIMFDERKMTAMMAQLSGVFPPLLDFMHPQDWNSCAYRLRRFFLPDPEAW
jgi:hypothetical protein